MSETRSLSIETAVNTALLTLVALCEVSAPQMAAAAPATWGDAIDVPLMVFVPLFSQADKMPCPGANRSTQVP